MHSYKNLIVMGDFNSEITEHIMDDFCTINTIFSIMDALLLSYVFFISRSYVICRTPICYVVCNKHDAYSVFIHLKK